MAMTRDEVLEQLEPVRGAGVRTMTVDRNTRINVTPDMVTLNPGRHQRSIEFANSGVESLANFIGLPLSIAVKLRPQTLGSAATELLQKKERFALVTQNNQVTGVVKDGTYNGLDIDRVLKSVERGVKGTGYNRVLIEGFAVTLEIIGERREAVKRGDLIQAGAQVRFSPIGTIDPEVQAYVLRLVCTNGMTSNHVLRSFRWTGGGGGGDNGGNSGSGDVWGWLQHSSKEAYEALAPVVESYRKMLNERIKPSDRAGMLEALLRTIRITGEDANAVRAMAVNDPPQNSYQLLNLMSHATSHIMTDPTAILRARRKLAEYSTQNSHARICPVCHTRRN